MIVMALHGVDADAQSRLSKNKFKVIRVESARRMGQSP